MKKLGRLSLVLAGAMCLTMMSGCGKKATASNNPAEALKEKYSQYVTLGDYKGLEYTPSHTEVTDADVQNQIDTLVSDATTTEKATTGDAKKGDSVNIDFVGTVDGVEFEGGNTNGNGTDITLGASGYIDGFDDQIVGHAVGDTFDVKVTFPDPYESNTDLSGKDAVFSTTLNYITISHVPEYNDELVAANTDYKTTADYEQYVLEALKEKAKTNDENTDKQSVLTAAKKNATISQYPEEELKSLVDDTVAQVQSAAESNGVDLNTYIMYVYGYTSEDDFTAYVEDTITNYLGEKIVVASIAKAEGITATKEDRDAKVQEILAGYNYTDESQLEGYYSEEDYYYYALAEKVVDFLMENAVVVESATATDASSTDASATDAE